VNPILGVCGMERDEGASFRTAETVPGVARRVRNHFEGDDCRLRAGLLTWPIIEINSDQYESQR